LAVKKYILYEPKESYVRKYILYVRPKTKKVRIGRDDPMLVKASKD